MRLLIKKTPTLITYGILFNLILSFIPCNPYSVRASNRQKPDAAAIGEAIRKLGTIASVLHTGAHPDDEDSGLLAYFARGRQARTAYLALTRGDGGQNLIGSDLYEKLGVIRTEELLAARQVDGAKQFFTRAYDFGFSKSRAEALSKWSQDELLKDMVRVIRQFRPLVIIPVFTGTSSDGHGHHQASGYLTPIAYQYAGDPTKFPEQIAEGLRPWKAKKLFIRSGGFQQPRNEPSKEKGVISINTGQFDALFGRSYFEIAMQGRSLHRSQDQGALQLKGDRYSFYKVADSNVEKTENPKDVFDGIDVSLAGIADFAGQSANRIRPQLIEAQKIADEVKEKFNPYETGKLSPLIARGLQTIRAIREALSKNNLSEDEFYNTDFLLRQKEDDFADALTKTEGIVVDCLASDEMVVPGQKFKVSVVVYRNLNLSGNESADAANNLAFKLASTTNAKLQTPDNWLIEPSALSPSIIGTRFTKQMDFNVTVAKVAEVTEPYWLKQPRNGDLYVAGKGGIGIEPQAQPVIIAQVELEISGQKITIHQPAQFRFADKALGEIRRELKVAPEIAVKVSPTLLISPTSNKITNREIIVTLTNNSKDKQTGSLQLNFPSGIKSGSWSISPENTVFDLTRKGEQATFTLNLKIPANSPVGDYEIKTVAKTTDGRSFSKGYQLIAYPHIEPRLIYQEAVTKVKVFDVAVAQNLKVGFIEGAGDEFANALLRLGVDVHILDTKEVASGDLNKYDTIVTGIRVYEVRPDVIANNKRLLEYVKNGGTLIVQYNKNEYATGNFAPYPVKMPTQGFERVTDENAQVAILEPAHPLFNFPNKITEKDFEGWGQERGVYFLTEWNENFKPLLASHDPGETDKKGGEVIAQYGKGNYVYTGYAWFRQLPNGVMGAYRLIANLVSLPKAKSVQKAVKK
ncbi:MAG: PIG-L family deacetylase [Acidobacteriota bacterium]